MCGYSAIGVGMFFGCVDKKASYEGVYKDNFGVQAEVNKDSISLDLRDGVERVYPFLYVENKVDYYLMYLDKDRNMRIKIYKAEGKLVFSDMRTQGLIQKTLYKDNK